MNDLRFAFRQLLKNPGFTAVAVLTLALGIGANTAIFSVIDAVLLKALPVKNPEQLVALNHSGGDRSGNGFPYPVFERLRDRDASVSDLFAFSTWPEVMARINGGEERLPGGALMVSGNYFAALGIKPLLGRLISPEDNRDLSGHPVAVLNHGFWQRRFGADRSIIGQSIHLNGTPYTVIGVTPPDFFGVRVGRPDAITVPIMMLPRMMPAAAFLQNPSRWDVEIMGRLQPPRTEIQAEAGLRVAFQQIEHELEGGSVSPDRLKIIQDRRIDLAPASKGLSALRRQFSEPLRILMGVAGMVLLIACANVANLLLARANARRKEIAVRLAIGSGRLQLARLLLIESALLALLGGAAGLVFANWVAELCLAFIPDRAGAIDLNLSLDTRLLAFTIGASVVTSILFGLAPAWQATRVNAGSALKGGGQNPGHDGRRFWLGQGLVSAQIALSLVLLVAAGLFVRTFQNLKGLNPGFETRNVLLFALDSRMRNAPPEREFALFQQLLERIGGLPPVLSATVSRDGNFGGGGRTRTTISVEGAASRAGRDHDLFDVPTGPRFFETLGVSLRLGREFTFQDDQRAPKVAILNETAARNLFGSENPIGQRIGVGSPGDTLVIGVANDTKMGTLREEASSVMYRSFLQAGPPRRMTFAVRSAVPSTALLTLLKQDIDAHEPNLPVFGFTTLDEMVDRSLAQERLFAALSSLFGALALVLAAIGLYGVLAFSVGQRTREIGLRMALGALNRSIFRWVMSQGMKLIVIGLATGWMISLALTRFIASRLYGVAPADPMVLIGVSMILVVIAFFACWFPAWRATKVDPMTALRTE